jgi:hypothetical protein
VNISQLKLRSEKFDDHDDDNNNNNNNNNNNKRTGAVSHNSILQCPKMHIMPQHVSALIKSHRQ